MTAVMVFGLSIYSQTPPPNPTPTPTTVPPTPTSTPVPAACSSVSDPNCIEVVPFPPGCAVPFPASDHVLPTFFLADGKCHPNIKGSGYYQLTCADQRIYGGVFCNKNDTTGFCTNCVTISSSFDANFANSGQGAALSEPGTANPECHFNKAAGTSLQVYVLRPFASIVCVILLVATALGLAARRVLRTVQVALNGGLSSMQAVQSQLPHLLLY
jgi:hypothetical protein